MNTSALPATARGQARRLAMIDAAKDVFLEHGYERTTLDMVIANAGGSRRTLYECFGDKAGLFCAMVAANTEELISRLQALPADATGPAHILTHIARVFLDMVLSPEAIAIFRLMVAEGPKFPELGKAFYEEGPLRLRNHLTQYLQRASDNGELTVNDASLAARQFFGLIKSDYQMSALLCPAGGECIGEIETEVDAAVALFLKGYSPTNNTR
ncbi:MAG: TetR/AcrR family transcriptional regulator [Alcanivoracaceae bacterium]|nr:TetR/AcrR family transcriptional regulator [Alcanivoracaceae bacterium]